MLKIVMVCLASVAMANKIEASTETTSAAGDNFCGMHPLKFEKDVVMCEEERYGKGKGMKDCRVKLEKSKDGVGNIYICSDSFGAKGDCDKINKMHLQGANGVMPRS